MSFFQVWSLGIINPPAAFDELRKKPAPSWGFWAIIIRFVVTSLTSILALRFARPEAICAFLADIPFILRYKNSQVLELVSGNSTSGTENGQIVP